MSLQIASPTTSTVEVFNDIQLKKALLGMHDDVVNSLGWHSNTNKQEIKFSFRVAFTFEVDIEYCSLNGERKEIFKLKFMLPVTVHDDSIHMLFKWHYESQNDQKENLKEHQLFCFN
ncbi:CLUMA_CG005599, isoform A [Clunio marinus]|uniref:CLUMA_CG005599, isoform A n=1 Tax=Clunio marinus TaxID=568069 RepID=A0A1J1HVJ8_9DIPT|nr:CLUMA_CG005599, isoform A [Clunio marinus]